MEEFNENPFKKDTPVTPFSNSTEAEMWQGDNCSGCIKYEADSKKEEEAKCKMAYHIDLGYVLDGCIPLWAAKKIGCKYDPLYGTVYLEEICRCYDDGDENKPF